MFEIRGLKTSASSVEPCTVKGAKPRMGGLGLGDRVLGQRGSALIQFVLVLPIFLILVFGSFAVWRVISAKQSLASGTYQAARYLSVEGRYLHYYPDVDDDPDDWEDVARIIIANELKNNSLLYPFPQPIISFEPE
ncbi:MAG: TadE/TadG family type IV pilus assembly protein, partial [Dehalococcoidia bacterium]